MPVRAKAFLRALRQRKVVQLIKGPVPHQPSRLVLHGSMVVIWHRKHQDSGFRQKKFIYSTYNFMAIMFFNNYEMKVKKGLEWAPVPVLRIRIHTF